MSRHRDIRNMDYTDDYNGYDDIYGHSVDDDYYISPSNRQFIYNRENSRDQPKIGEYLRSEHGIEEEDNDDDDDDDDDKRGDNVRQKIGIIDTSEEVSDLTDLERAKLESCLDQIQSTLNSLSLLPKNEIINIAIAHKFNPEQTIDAILKEEELYQKQETDSTRNQLIKTKFVIPELKSPLKLEKLNIETSSIQKNQFIIPKFTTTTTTNVPKLSNQPVNKFSNLSDLVSNHLSKSSTSSLTLKGKLSLIDNKNVYKDEKIPSIIDNMNQLEISKDSPKKSFHKIDLTGAIKETISLNKNRLNDNNKNREKFEFTFIDGDVNLIKSEQQNYCLPCRWDCRQDLIRINFKKCEKKFSNLGRVICWKYRLNKTKRSIDFDDDFLIIRKRYSGFKFDTPSPDDLISSHLKQ